MSRFYYTAILESGKRVAGHIRCPGRGEALRELLGRGYHPLGIKPAAEGVPSLSDIAVRVFRRIKVSDLAVFTRQLAALLKAGLPMMQALATLQRQCEHKQLVKVINDIEETLSRHGGTLADALDEHPRVFDAVYRGLVRAGEEGGNLVEVLSNLASHLSRSGKLRGQVLGAFIYPMFIALLGCTAVFVLMAFVIPRFKEMFSTFGRGLPWPTKLLMVSSGFLADWWWAVLLCIGISIAFVSVILRRASVREKVDRCMLRLPVLGQMFLKLEICRISRTLGALLNGGVRMLDALRATAATARNGAIRRTFPAMIKGVSSGESLASVVEDAGVFPSLMINLIRTGEHTGDLPDMLVELSSIYEDEAERSVTGAVKLIEPILIVLVGGIVAGIVAAVMLPVFEANTMVR